MILLANEGLWVNTSVLSRIGNPECICLMVRRDGKRLVIVAATPSDPEPIPVRDMMYDDLPAECGQWLGLEVPEQVAPLLPKCDHLLEVHGVQLNPHILLFDLEDRIERTFDELFGNVEYAIIPPKDNSAPQKSAWK